FGIALTSLTARAAFGPVRKFDTESIVGNFLGGLRGTIMDKWDWETALSYGMDRVTTVSRNAIRASTYQAALNGTLSGFTGKFLNPFGYSDAGLTNALFTTSTATAKSEITTWDAHVSGTVLHLPGGEIGVAGGAEARNEVLTTNPDTAAYLGSGGGQPLTGERDIVSAYVEVTAPVFKWLEFQLAGRYEDYSDFGHTTKPKYGVKIKLPENKIANVILRGSYSESFQAPALGLLYQTQTVAFSSNVLQDPLRLQDPPVQQRIITGGNPHLLPEFGETKYAGVVVDIPAVKDLSFAVDYFDIRIDQVIVTPSATYLLSSTGMQQFPNAIVRDNSQGTPGPILYIQSVPSNNPAAYQKYRGLDYKINYGLRNTRFGDFHFGLEATQILEIGNDSGLGGGYFDNTGLYNNPEWRGQGFVGWNLKDWSATFNADYIGSYHNDGYVASPAGQWDEKPYTLCAASVTYRGFWGTQLTLGCNNLFDKQPPFNGYDTAGFDPNTYGAGAMGRFVYVRVRKDF
ncbi:MAG TPA: TonB-dependent receptor, partial [Candidatus Didemnitutus sp.]|nr:TonB-dependent receptor [Candidatus Didemnitutus sp.]